MEIKGVSNNLNHLPENFKKPEQEQAVNTQNQKDKLEISAKARELQSEKVPAAEFTKIRDKINSGFYNSEKAVNKVADQILRELTQE